MVNTLKKVVLGVLLGATVTVAFGAVNTFACDKADDPAKTWAEVRQEFIDNYKADLEEKLAEEKAAREAVRDEAVYKTRLADNYRKDVAFSEAYVKAVADQSRGLDRKAINDAKEFAASYRDNSDYWFDYYNSFKSFDDELDYYEKLTPEQQEEWGKDAPEIKWDKDNNYEAAEKAWKATHPNGLAD